MLSHLSCQMRGCALAPAAGGFSLTTWRKLACEGNGQHPLVSMAEGRGQGQMEGLFSAWVQSYLSLAAALDVPVMRTNEFPFF